jgi:hypothetical protein
MQRRDEEHDPESGDTHALEHAERTGFESEDIRGVEGIAHHAGADECAGEIDLLAAVEHGA